MLPPDIRVLRKALPLSAIRSPFLRQPSTRSGIALVIVLAFVVLLTGLILAFFSRAMSERQLSNSSANQTKVDVFAHGAIETIIGDLKQEIAAGSTPMKDSAGAAVAGTWFPTSPSTMVPQPVGVTYGTPAAPNGLENLIKLSAFDYTNSQPLPLFSGTNDNTSAFPAPARAAGVSTATPSQNGRAISRARWNSHFLLGKQNTTSDTDQTPVSVFTAPDWILVARNGRNPTTWSNDLRWSSTAPGTVIGRYAYAIYDEGGLLDMNVAGYPTGMTPEQIGGKGSLGLADLTAVGLTQEQIDAVVGWRNYASIKPGGSLSNGFDFSDAAIAQRYLTFATTNTKGFLTVGSPALYNGQSDRMFPSRQSLMELLTQGIASTKAQRASLQNALQYLGTFSRDLEQPSFNPEPNLTSSDPNAKRPKNTLSPIGSTGIGNGNDAYDPTGATQDKINPAVLTVRNSNGSLVLKQRFPLGRLAFLEQAAEILRTGGSLSTSQEERITDHFGLKWVNAEKRWKYDHGDPNKILRLSEIPAGREPDFFEVLKASIHVDSLGKQRGGLDATRSAHGTGDISPTTGEQRGALLDGQIENQIFQIGASLIDQYDQDSYPTRLGYEAADPAGATTFRDFYGIENLPYLAGWQQMWYRMRALVQGVDINTAYPTGTPPATGTTYETVVMVQPIIWNPIAPEAGPSPPGVPAEFRIVASGETGISPPVPFHPQTAKAWWTPATSNPQFTFPVTKAYRDANNMTPSGTYSPNTLYAFPNANLDGVTSFITFSTGSGDAGFREPFRLRSPNYPPGSNAANNPAYTEGRITVSSDTTLIDADGGSSTVIGFNCGKVWTGPAMDSNNTQQWLSVGSMNRDLMLKLEYKDASGNWQTYDVIPNVHQTNSQVSTVDNADSGDRIRAFHAGIRADPRTNRWGLFHMAVWPSTNASDTPDGVNQIGDNGVDRGYANNGITHHRLPQGITWNPNANSTYIMAQAGDTSAPGWRNSQFYPSDLMANLPRSPNDNPNSGTPTTATPGAKYFHTDPDAVFRRSSGWNFSANGDGLPLYTATGNYNSRPVILNRPFRSVAEMGYAFRGQAWRNIDFFTPESGDAALLDAFSLNELDNAPGDMSVAGRVNLNTRQPKVLQALIQGVSKAEGGTLAASEAQAVSEALVKWTTADPADSANLTNGVFNKGPLRNRSELVGKFVYRVPFTPIIGGLTGEHQNYHFDGSKSYSGFSSVLTSGSVFSNAADKSIKRRAESVMRALADSGNARTWNLLIDTIAQVGRYPASGNTDLSKFIVQGETRYWVHVAIDRNTGEIVTKLLEPVTE
jgi:hypothetical protein